MASLTRPKYPGGSVIGRSATVERTGRYSKIGLGGVLTEEAKQKKEQLQE